MAFLVVLYKFQASPEPRAPTEGAHRLTAHQARSYGKEQELGDDAMVKNRGQDRTVASGGDDAIIPSRRKGDDVKDKGNRHNVIA